MGKIEQAFAMVIHDHRAGRLSQAEQRCRGILEQDSGHVEALHKLGILALRVGNARRAIIYLGRAVTCGAANPACHNNLGAAAPLTGPLAEAAVALEQALRLAPDSADARNNLGMAFEKQGRLALAQACYHLAQFAAQDLPHFTSESIEQGKALPADGRLRAADASQVHFALTDVLDRQERHDDAFAHYRTANDLIKQHRAERHRAWIDQAVAVFDPEYCLRVRSLGSESERPVFVVGMPRSDTTRVAPILSSHPLVCSAGERPDLPKRVAAQKTRLGDSSRYPACMAKGDGLTVQDLAKTYLQRLSRVNGTAHRIVDTLPTNCLHLGLIVTLFPRARIIHCRREPQGS